MKLDYESCNAGKDFEAICDIPEDWYGRSGNLIDERYQGAYIWFKAYDVNAGLYDESDRFKSEGFEFECLVRLEIEEFEPSYRHRSRDLAKFGALNKPHAERMLQLAADALFQA